MTTREERNEKFILDEYAAAGLKPIQMRDGRPVSLALARQNGAVLAPAHPTHPTHEAGEKVAASI